MKIVIKIENTSLQSEPVAQALALVAKRFIGDRHRLVIVHGDNDPPVPQSNGNGQNEAKSAAHLQVCLVGNNDPALEMICGNPTKALRAALKIAGLTAIRLSGADGNIFRVRQGPAPGIAAIAATDPFWLEVIASNGGIPLVDNLTLNPGQKYCWINTDQVASACAIGWDADALIVLSENHGLEAPNGAVIRWLSVGKLPDFLSACKTPSHILSKLNACRDALQHGVRRARIFPVSQLASLSSFYISRIDYGTEVVLLDLQTKNPDSSLIANFARI